MTGMPTDFRVWSFEYERMFYNLLHIYFDEDGRVGGVEAAEGHMIDLRDTRYVEPEGVLMQHTGQSDYENNPVYAGDIIDLMGNPPRIVDYVPENAGWALRRGEDYMPLLGDFLGEYFEGTVAGNMYEDPELLETEDGDVPEGWGTDVSDGLGPPGHGNGNNVRDHG